MTSLVHGQCISAEEIERIVSREFSPQTFVRLCNSVAWASAGKECSSLPSFTESIYVPDGGRDAEWTVEIPPIHQHSSAFLSSGWNVYQYKHRDVSARNRTEIVSKLKTNLKGALKDLIDRNKRQPSRYVFFTNLHLTLDEQNELRAKIFDGCEQPEVTAVEVVEAAFLASSLNNLPHLRSSFFSTAKFTTWQQAWFEHENKKIYGANISLVGRDKPLSELKTLIDNSEVQVVMLSGAKDMGKTRLVLEATKQCAIRTVISINRTVEVSDLRYLESPSFEIIVIVEDPNPNEVKNLVNQVLSSRHLKLVITLPTSENLHTINFGLDKRIKELQLFPLLEEESRELLKASEARFDYAMETWVVKHAGGNPGILLLAAKQGATLREEPDSFLEQIAKTIEQEIREKICNNAVDVLKLLSLLDYVELKGRDYREIKILCKWFGQNFQFDAVVKVIGRLTEAGFLQIRGVYAEVTPPLLANHLAASLLQGRRSEFLALFADLSQPERSRLIQRLQWLSPEKIAWFWDEIFNPDGLLRDLSSAIYNREIFYLAACANPDRTIKLIEQSLKPTTLEQRKSLQYSERNALVWVLEELIFRERTSLRALQCLGRIAETEPTSTNNSSSTGKFCQCFRPLHSQVPLLLEYRLELLKKFASSNQSTIESRLLVIEVIKTTLYRWGYHFLREGKGNKPFDPMPQMTWGDVWSYQEALLMLLVELAQSDEPQVAEAARQALPTVIAEFSMLQFSPEITISAFQKTVGWVVNQQISLPISKLADALHGVYNFYNKDENKSNSQIRVEGIKLLNEIIYLLDLLNNADFSVRLKRWASSWTRSHNEYELDEHGQRIYRDEYEAKTLAEEVINEPSILTIELLEWLCSVEAQEAHNFCFWLGKLDFKQKWLTQIETIGIRQNCINIFSAYLGGLSQIDRQFVSNYLDKLTELGEVKAEAIVFATQLIGGDIEGVNRMVKLIRDKRVDPSFVENVLECGKWLATLNSDEYLHLLKAIGGSDLRNAAAVVKSFFGWLHLEKKIDGSLAEFAWNCLEASDTAVQDYYYFDQLALHLVQTDIERGFKLLEKLLLKQLIDYKYWNPIDRNHKREFWDFLYECNREVAIKITLAVLQESYPYQSHRIIWHIQGIINQEEEAKFLGVYQFCALARKTGVETLAMSLLWVMFIPQWDTPKFLIEFALESEAKAKIVCDILSIQNTNFWQVAFEIITQYPDSQEIKDALSYLVVQPSPLTSRLEYLENGLNVVEQALSERNPPFDARSWLDELSSDLRIKITKEQGSKEVEQISTQTLMSLSRPLDIERIWAVRGLLHDGETDRIRQLLSQDEMLKILAMPDISETERQQIRNIFGLDNVKLSASSNTSGSIYITSVERLTLMSNQSPIFNQQYSTIGVNYAAEGSKQEFTQNVAATEQNFEVLLADFEQFISDLQQKYPNVTDETAIQIIEVEAKELQQKQPLRWQKFLDLKRLWNGGKKAAFKVGEHYAEQNPLGKGAIAFLEGVMEDPK